jgi:hypothetical protein
VSPHFLPVVFLHLGAMKTGTTFLQHLITANRASLAKAGLFFPGTSWSQQTLATRDVLGTGTDPRLRARVSGLWERLVSEMLEYDGRASLFSMEFLSFANETGAANVMRSLDGATVHLILTVRDTTGALPAQWQSNARNAGKVSWPEFVHGAMRYVRRGPEGAGAGGRVFRRAQDIPRMLRVWGEFVPPERFHVITVPPSGGDRMLLWERFAGVLGVDPETCGMPTTHTNTSLGQPSADLMRRINIRLRGVPQTEYDPTMKGHLATRVLSRRAPYEQRAKLDLTTRKFAADWNRTVRRAIEASSVDLVGDLGDLPVKVPLQFRDRRARLVDPDADAILGAAADARLGMARLVRLRSRRLRTLGVEVGRLPRIGDRNLPIGPERWDGFDEPVEAAVDEVSALVRRAIDLNNRLREVAPKYARRKRQRQP